MMQLVTHDWYGEFVDDLAEMHRLRYRVFKERLGWDVQVCGGMEIDEFDSLHPAYLLHRGSDDRLQGCVRLLPSLGPNMLRDTFPVLLSGRPAPASPVIWESSRFALDAAPNSAKAVGGLTRATYELFAGMIEFGLSRRLTDIVTVTDVRMERILRRAGWPLVRIGAPTMLDATLAVAGYLKISVDSLARVRANGDLRRPILWTPVVRAAA